MLLLSSSDVLRVITDSAATLDVHVSWVDRLAGADTPGKTDTAISSAVASPGTTFVASPATSTFRNCRYISITNRHATLSDTLTIQTFNGSTAYQLGPAVVLKPGYSYTYRDGLGWLMSDAAGGRVESPLVGRYLGTSVLTSASANFTTSPSTNTIYIRGVAGGGGGAGCTSVSSAASAGGGGGAGGYAEKAFAVTPNTAYAYTCGALGAGASGALGGTGGDSTFVVGATTVTCKGGVGAPVATAVAALTAYVGGAGGAVSTNGDVNSAGAPGGNGVVVVVATPVGTSGEGGSSPLGAGGVGISAAGNGNAGAGHGSGGGGALTGAAAVRTGGSGTAGCWVVDEYT